uniref:Uncharacterized protein n=1 Tax=Lotus japonicus TaxID=34305 RepID=I3S874_LOTJA|nr:unknown [Lotus japonicus]
MEKLEEMEDKINLIHMMAFQVDDYKERLKSAYQERSKIIDSIPGFWFTVVLLKHPAYRQLFNQEDHKIFQYFTSLEVEDGMDVNSSYSITFNFKPNPYFENTKLQKTLTFLQEGTTKITATPIKWKQNNQVPADFGFFSWFTMTEQKDDVHHIHDEIACLFKDDVWKYALFYFKMESYDSDEEWVDS